MNAHYDPTYLRLENRRRVVEFLKNKNAMSAATAVEVSASDWATLGINPKQYLLFLGDEFSYLAKTDAGKFWLNEQLLQEHMDKEGTFIKDTYPKLLQSKAFPKKLFWIIGIIFGIALLIMAMILMVIITIGGGILHAFTSFV
jgi:hypothetical protein